MERWLRRDPDGSYVVRDEVRDLVEFAHHNLVTDPPPFPPGGVDLVVCRHVTIYFSRETTRSLVARFRDVLGGTGWLLMGPAESLWQVSDAFALQSVGEAFAYRAHRVAPTARPPRPGDPPPGLVDTRRRARHARRPRTRSADRGSTQPDGGRATGPPRAGTAASRAGAAGHRLRRGRRRTRSRRPRPRSTPGRTTRPPGWPSEALVADPVSSPAYLLLGHARLNQGEAATAVEPLQRAVFLDPLAGHAHFLLAVALSAAGRSAQAAPAYRAAANTLAGRARGDGPAAAGRT